MRVARDPTIINQRQPLHLAIGMFDGVHLGHRAVIESAVHAAKARGGHSAVLTFDPHPSRIIRPENPTLLLQTPQQKEACIEKLGVDLLVWQTFTMDLASVGAEDYVARLKARMPTLESIHVGENFRFGKGRSGDISTLLAKAAQLGIHVISIERVRYDGEPVSSSRIRSIVSEGRIDYAGDLLGYDYCCEGVVEPGAKLGRKLGFPTLNIRWAPPCKPRLGVYLVSVRRAGGARRSTPWRTTVCDPQ
jgi:riboflavin kinase/FMN adenylyltransferase